MLGEVLGVHTNYFVGFLQRADDLMFLPIASLLIWKMRANPNMAGPSLTTTCGLPVGTEGARRA